MPSTEKSYKVTRRQQAQAELCESEAQFRALANAIPTLCWMANADGWITWYNERWYEYTGATPEQMEGWGWQSVHDPEELPKVLERWKGSIATGEPFEMVFPLRGADGVFRPFLTRVVPVKDQDGKLVRWFGTNTDISEQRKIEEALRQSLQRLEKVLEVETVGVIFWDLNTGCMVDANDTFLELMGYSRVEVERRELSWQKLTPPEYMDVSRAEIDKLLATGRVGPYEKEYFRKDGTRHWLLFAGSSLGNKQCVEFCVDISDRKKAEQALAKSESRLRAVLDSLPVAVFTADSVGQLTDVNPATREIWAGAPMLPMSEYSKEYRGWWPDTGRRVASHEWPLSRAVKGETIRDVMVEIESFDGKRKFLRIDASPIRGPRGENYGAVAVTTDITERKRAEDALRESEQRFRDLADNISQFAWMADANGWIYWYNQRWYEYTGTNLEQMQGWGWQKVHHPEHIGRVVVRFEHSLETGEPWEDTFPLRGKDGQYRWFLSRALPIRDAEGRVVRWFGTNTDITEQRKAEEALKREADLLKLSFDAILLWRWDGPIESWSPGAERLYGFPAQEAVGRISHDLLKTVFPEPFAQIRAKLQEKGAWEGDLRHHTRDGREIIVSGRLQMVRDAEGVERVLEINRDITERKQAEEALLRMNALVESSEDAIISKTLEGVITSWNQGAERLYGYSEAEALGKNVSVLVPAGHLDEIPEILRKLASGHSIHHYEAVRRRKDGSLVDVSLKISPIRDSSGKVVAASTIARDITERKRAEQEIRRLNTELEDRVRRRTVELESANKELEAFAYSVSHDLRAPLRGIDGWSLALIEDYESQLDETAHEYLGRVRSETQRMGLLIDDLLKLSRATRVKMEIGTIDLSSMAHTIAARLTEANSERRIEFMISDGLEVTGDARLLEIVLTNLFSNAVKFTGPRAEARVEFGRAERDGERPFYVRDNGVGFDMAFAGALFGAFQRLHPSEDFPGTGIGLATVQRIIHRHGGRVWAEAQPDQGATFYFTVGRS